jgi:hypothetical protein
MTGTCHFRTVSAWDRIAAVGGTDHPKFNRRVNLPGKFLPFVHDPKARRWALVLLASVVVGSFEFGPIGAVASLLVAAPIIMRLERRPPDSAEPSDPPDAPTP